MYFCRPECIPEVGLFLVSATAAAAAAGCCDSGLLSAAGASGAALGMRSLVSWGLLGSSASAVAFTRGGRPGGSVTGKVVAGAALEVRVTGTTATGASGARAAAMGTSGLTSEGSVSEEAAAAAALGWSAAGGATEGSRAATAASGSALDSARPFRALGAGDAARARGASERVFSAIGV